MANDFNYGACEFKKLDQDAERFHMSVRSDTTDDKSAQTRWIGLTPDQYRQVQALIVSFNLG